MSNFSEAEMVLKGVGRSHVVLNREDFMSEVNGVKTDLYTLSNSNGMEVAITNFGARIVSICVPDVNGKFDDVALGFDNLADYRGGRDHAFGATIGRYANRIGSGQFSLNGKQYSLEKNKGTYCLHSGKASWMHLAWRVDSHSPGHLTLSHISPDGEGGFPGEVLASVTYSLSDKNVLRIVFNAESDQETVVNMTNHSYFNLAGAGSGDVTGHLVRIHSQAITDTDTDLVPTGKLKLVEGTPLDLRQWTTVGEGIRSGNADIECVNGYDFNYVVDQSSIDPDGLTLAAEVREPRSGRALEVWTNQPGVQFYTGNSIREGAIGKGQASYGRWGGLCLETQHFPDSPNHPDFPSTQVDPDRPYHRVCEYRFGIRK